MNKQLKIKGGVITSRGIEWCDYTWNPLVGCLHGCRWIMPSGKEAICYAETQVEGHWLDKTYPGGFETIYWKPERLNQPLNVKKPSKIFVGSLTDVFGHWQETAHIEAVLDICRKASQHTFQFLTKNPVRVKLFDIPQNCWIGASTPPDFMWGQKLSIKQRSAMMDRTLAVLAELKTQGITTWSSAEPLTIDLASYLDLHTKTKVIDEWLKLGKKTPPVDWIVIGAASDGPRYYPPSVTYFERLVNKAYELNIKLFYKGNLKSLPEAAADWREEFPS
jgi:DNA repair photolyase